MKRFKSLMVMVCVLGFLLFPSFNASVANAQTFSNLSCGVAVNGTVTQDDSKTYQFTTNKDGETYITLDKATAGLNMTLTDEYGNQIRNTNFSNGGGSVYIDEILQKGTYYVTIEPYYWNGTTSATYRVKATYPGSFTRNTATFEPNDTYETAYPVNSGQFYNSTMESDIDSDVYQFTTTKDGEAYITLDQATAGLYLSLFDSNGNRVRSTNFSNSGGSSYIDENLQKGTYYIAINPYYWNGTTKATYRLRATYSGPINRNSTTFEPNDTFGTAYRILSGKTYSTSLFSQLDADVYQFTTARDGKATITLSHSRDGLSLSLYDAYGNYITSQNFSNGGESSTITENLAKGTYYATVNSYYWRGTTSTNYQLKAAFQDKTPTVNTVSDRSTTITGSAESHSKVYAYVGSKRIGYTTANYGKYSMKIANQKAGTVISVYLIDSSGIQSGSRYVTVLDKTPPSAPTVYKVTSRSTTVSGKTERYASVYVYKGNKYIGYGKADHNGYFKVKIKAQRKGSFLKVYAKDSAKNISVGRTVRVY